MQLTFITPSEIPTRPDAGSIIVGLGELDPQHAASCQWRLSGHLSQIRASIVKIQQESDSEACKELLVVVDRPNFETVVVMIHLDRAVDYYEGRILPRLRGNHKQQALQADARYSGIREGTWKPRELPSPSNPFPEVKDGLEEMTVLAHMFATRSVSRITSLAEMIRQQHEAGQPTEESLCDIYDERINLIAAIRHWCETGELPENAANDLREERAKLILRLHQGKLHIESRGSIAVATSEDPLSMWAARHIAPVVAHVHRIPSDLYRFVISQHDTSWLDIQGLIAKATEFDWIRATVLETPCTIELKVHAAHRDALLGIVYDMLYR